MQPFHELVLLTHTFTTFFFLLYLLQRVPPESLYRCTLRLDCRSSFVPRPSTGTARGNTPSAHAFIRFRAAVAVAICSRPPKELFQGKAGG